MQEGERIGVIYGKFQAKLDSLFFYLFNTDLGGLLAGVHVWDRMSNDDRRSALATVNREIEQLPKLPPTSTLQEAMALREGFKNGAGRAYESKRTEYWAVHVASELATTLIATLITGGVAPLAINAIRGAAADKFGDCAAHTASRIFLEMSGTDVSAGYLARTFGLPRSTILSFKTAVDYAKNYFTKLGIAIRPRAIALEAGVATTRYPIGRYVIFMEGTDGHVVFGEITQSGITIIDDQLGKRWTSIIAAQNDLRMTIRAAYLVESATPPL